MFIKFSTKVDKNGNKYYTEGTKMKELFLERRGCEFFKQDEQLVKESDIGNYRIVTPGETIRLKDGRSMLFEFGRNDRYAYRKTHKITGKPLKHVKRDLVMTNALTVGTQFENASGCWRDSVMEREFYNLPPVKYTEENILNYVNSVSSEHYDKITYVERLEIDQEYGSNFVPSRKMIDYAKKHHIAWCNKFGETYLKLYTGVYKYHHYEIKGHNNGETETLTIWLERVGGSEEE